jgi:hypothetical protein
VEVEAEVSAGWVGEDYLGNADDEESATSGNTEGGIVTEKGDGVEARNKALEPGLSAKEADAARPIGMPPAADESTVLPQALQAQATLHESDKNDKAKALEPAPTAPVLAVAQKDTATVPEKKRESPRKSRALAGTLCLYFA